MKAQVWSFDMAISILIFFSAMTALMFTWNYITAQNLEQFEISNAESQALRISDSLVRTQGIPVNWESGNPSVLGLASSENILDDAKIEALLAMDYNSVKSLLGIEGYQLYLALIYANSTIAKTANGTQAEFGMQHVNEKIIVPVDRYCLYNGDIVTLRLILWTQL